MKNKKFKKILILQKEKEERVLQVMQHHKSVIIKNSPLQSSHNSTFKRDSVLLMMVLLLAFVPILSKKWAQLDKFTKGSQKQIMLFWIRGTEKMKLIWLKLKKKKKISMKLKTIENSCKMKKLFKRIKSKGMVIKGDFMRITKGGKTLLLLQLVPNHHLFTGSQLSL